MILSINEFILKYSGRLIASLITIGIIILILLVIKVMTLKVNKQKNKRAVTVGKMIFSVCKYFCIVLAVIIVLVIWGVNLSGAIAGAGAAGLILTLAFRSLITDFVAGIGIILENYYEIDETVEINGFKGRVLDVGVRTTQVINWYGEVRFILNGDIRAVTNFSRFLSLAAITVGIPYDADIDQAIQLLEAGLAYIPEKFPQAQAAPKVVGVSELGDSAVMLRITVKTEAEQHYAVQREMLKAAKIILEKANMGIPFNQLDVRVVRE